VSELGRVRRIVGADEKVAEDVSNAKHDDFDGIIRNGVDRKCGGMETVVFEWDHKILSGVPFAMLVESVIHGEPG